jgi:sugar lactone lactonase YvrE
MPGFWYSSGSLPDSMNNSLFVADFSGWIRAFSFDEDYQLIKVSTIKEDVKGIVRMAFHEEEQAIYYVDIEENTLHRLIYDGNPRPIALIEVDKNYGASPLTVSFDGSGS